MQKTNWKDGSSFAGRTALFATLALSLMRFFEPFAQAQAPTAVFSASAANLGQTAKVYPTMDGLAGAYRVAVNSRGDTFWLDANYAGTSQTLIEVPAGSTPGDASQVPLITNVYRSSGTAYVDPNQNLWVAEYNGNLIYVPFLNNAYPAAFDATKLTACALPLPTVTAPCNFTKMDLSAYGYYVNAADLFIDASGDIFLIDRQAGTFIRILEIALGTTAAAPVTTTVVTNLPFNATPGNIVVNTNGDMYYADRTNLYYVAAGSGNNSVTLPGFKNPTGLTFDSAGNLYVTDTGNSRIAVIPKIGSALSVSNTYTVANVLANGGVAIDKYGNITYSTGNGTTGYVTSIVQLPVGSRNFGSVALGSSSGATELDLAFPVGATFGSFTIAGGTGTAPFALATNGCIKGTAYTVGASCSVTITYTPTAAGPQVGAVLAYDNSGNFLGSASLSGIGLGSLLNVDPGTVTAIGSGWNAPSSIAVDSARSTYIADSITGAIYKNGGTAALVSGFNAPSAVAVDGAGNLYVADSGNSRIMRVPYVNGAYGAPVAIYTGLSGPSGLALDAAGNLYIADSGNARVVLLAASAGYPIGTISSTIGSGYAKPVAVALDGAGNVYVADDGAKTVVEWIVSSNTKTTIVTGLTTAGGIAFDPGGSLFVVDKGKKTITRIPSVAGVLSSNSSTVLSSIVSSPVALAIDASGSVYAADTADATVGTMVRTAGSLSYGPIVQTVSSQALTAVISNAGTSSLVFSSPYYSATGSTSAFAIQSSSTCANGATISTGTTCTLSAVFTPPAVAAYSETLVFAGNASSSSSLALSGTGVILVNATITGPTTLTYGYGATTYSVTASHDGSYNVNITGTSASSVPIVVTNGVASFTVPTLGVGTYTIALAGAVGTASLNVTPATLTLTAANASRSFGTANPAFAVTASGTKNGDSYVLSGTSVASIASPTGPYPIVPSASGPGLSNYNLVLVNGVLTVTTAASNTTQTVTSSNAFIQSGTVTFSATVKASLPAVGNPTGTVAFENATYPSAPVVLGTGTIANGVATFQTTALPTGTIAVIAVYSGDTNFAGSSTVVSTAVTIGVPTFTLQISQGQGGLASVLPMTITRGQTGSATLTVTPVGPFAQPVTFYCSNLPLEASCSFFNSTLTPNGGPVTATVVISTTAAAKASLDKARPWSRSEGSALLALMVGTFVSLRKKRRLAQRLCAFLLISAGVMLPISGCGISETPFITPLGVSQVTITASSAPIATQQSVTVRLAVTQ